MTPIALKGKINMPDLMKIAGRVIHKDAEVILIFRVRGKLYPSTEHNSEIMDAYMHTGDKKYLKGLENEMEVAMPDFPQYEVQTEMSDSLSAAILNSEMGEQ